MRGVGVDDGQAAVLAEDLTAPGGVALRDGKTYVTTGSVLPDAGQGSSLRL